MAVLELITAKHPPADKQLIIRLFRQSRNEVSVGERVRERVWRKGVRMILMDLYNYPHVCLLPTKSILFLSSSAMSTSTPQRRKKRISAYFSCSKDGNSVIRCRAYATDSSVPSPLPSPDQVSSPVFIFSFLVYVHGFSIFSC